MSSLASPPSPRRTINDLLSELKARIVELCAEQDERYKKWSAAFASSCPNDLEPFLKQQIAAHGQCISSLFRTSIAWSELASPYRFKVLRASKVGPTFHFRISPHRLGLFAAVHLDSTDFSNLSAVLAQTSSMIGLSTLKIDGTAAKENAATALAVLASRIRTLEVQGMKTADFTGIASYYARNLTTLRVTAFAHWTDTARLRPLFSSLRHLKTLSISSSVDDDLTNIPFSALTTALEAEEDILPTLRTLEVEVESFDDSLLSFISLFSTTLERLALSFDISNEDFDDASLALAATDEVFPRLHTLHIEGNYFRLDPFFSSLSPSTFPSIHTVSYGVSGALFDDYHFGSIARVFPCASTICLYHPHWGVAHHEAEYARSFFPRRASTVTTARGENQPEGAFFATPYRSRRHAEERDTDDRAAVVDVDERVAFLNEAVKHAKRTGDEVAIAR